MVSVVVSILEYEPGGLWASKVDKIMNTQLPHKTVEVSHKNVKFSHKTVEALPKNVEVSHKNVEVSHKNVEVSHKIVEVSYKSKSNLVCRGSKNLVC